MSYSFNTSAGTATSVTIPVSVDTTGYTLSVEFSRRSDFSSPTVKTPTASGKTVTVALTSAEVDTVGSGYYRVKAVKSGKTSYIQTGRIAYAEGAPVSASALVGTDGKIKTELLPATTTSAGGSEPVSYYIYKEVAQGPVKARARANSGLPAIPDGTFSAVMQAAVNNLTVKNGDRGVSGGHIHMARPPANDVYHMNAEVVITGWESIPFTNGVPVSGLTISGESGTQVVQTTGGQNGFVVKNLANVTFRDFGMYIGSSAKSGILGADTGADSPMSFWRGGLYNIMLASNSTIAAPLHIKNQFSMTGDQIVVQSSHNHGVVFENNSATTNFGNSHFGFISSSASASAPYAAFRFISTTPGKSTNLMTFGHLESVDDAYYGIYTKGASWIKVNYVDLEAHTYNMYFDGDATYKSRHIHVDGGYLLPKDTGTAIYCGAEAGGIRVEGVYIETLGGGVPINDQNLYQPNSFYDVQFYADADWSRAVFADANKHTLRRSPVNAYPTQRFTGTIQVPTAAAGDNNQNAANTAWVRTYAPSGPAAGTAGLRQLGTSGTTAAAGNDTRFTTIAAVTQTGTNYTLTTADARKIIEMNNAAANTVTVPANATAAFPVGTVIDVMQIGAGATTIAPAAGVTLRAPLGLRVAVQYGSLRLRKRATDEWIVENISTPPETFAPVLKPMNYFTDPTTLATWMGGRHLQSEAAGALTFTIPTNATAAFPVGTDIDIVQGNVGEVLIAPAAGVDLRSRDGARKLAGRYAAATLRKVDTNVWHLYGDIVA